MSFELPKLNYAYDALEPVIDARTMEIHHTKHHQAYVDNLNNAIKGTEHEGKSIEEICKTASDVPAIRNNGGGHFNHTLFWEILTPGGSKEPVGNVKKQLSKLMVVLKNSKKIFLLLLKQIQVLVGLGYVKKEDGSLEVCSSANQDNTFNARRGCGNPAILGLDVWEHAYYLHYQNRRPDYVSAFLK